MNVTVQCDALCSSRENLFKEKRGGEGGAGAGGRLTLAFTAS